MLSPADQAIVQRDESLPGLGTVLDPPAMAELLSSRSGIRVDSLRITYVRYKPRTSCLVGYEAEVGRSKLLLSVHARDPHSPEKLAKTALKPGVPGPLGPGRFVIGELFLSVSVLPNDPELKQLKRLSEGGELRVARELVGERRDLRHRPLRVLSYRPARRCVAQILVDDRPAALVKFYAAADFERVERNARAFSSAARLYVPDVIALSERFHAVTSEWVHGAPFDWSEGAALRTGEALAELHRQVRASASLQPRKRHSDDLRRLAQDIAFLCPSLQPRLVELTGRIERALAERGATEGPIHGDFHPEQLVLLDGQVALIDFDEARLGDPASDLGNFLAHAQYRSLTGRLEAPAADVAGALSNGYSASGDGAALENVHLQTARSLVKLAPQPFRERLLEWPGVVAALLDLAEAELMRHKPGAVPRASSGEPTTTWSAVVDAALEAEELAVSTGGTGTVAYLVRSRRLMRQKPGVRCLIEFDVINGGARPQQLVGKVRHRGVDTRTWRLNKLLWNRGFDRDAPDGIMVPEPIGAVAELSLWLQRKILGDLLSDLLVQGEPPAAERVAEAVAKLHRTHLHLERRHTAPDELRILGERLSGFAGLHPEMAERTYRLLSACKQLAKRLDPAQPHTIHRDLYSDHLVLSGESIYLLDLDLACEGDPAIDVGNFLAHLTELALRRCGRADAFRHWADVFRRAYLAIQPGCSRNNIATYELLSLARLVEISARMPDRRHLTGEMLLLCEHWLERGSAAESNSHD